MNIGINAHLLSLADTYRATGVSNYISSLLSHLSSIDSANNYRVFSGKYGQNQEIRSNLPLTSNFHFCPSQMPLHYPPIRLLWEQSRLSLHTLGLDIVHGPVNVVPLASRARRIVTIHDLAFMLYTDKHMPSKRRYLTLMTRLSVRRSDYIIAVSEATRRNVIDLLGAAPGKVITVPQGVDSKYHWLGKTPQGREEVETFRRQKNLPDRYFFYLGTLEPRKNIPLLIKAYAQLHREGLGRGDDSRCGMPKLVIAGPKGWLYDDIYAVVKQLNLEEHVLFPGFVPREEINLWYNAALGFVYLSAHEGFGLPPLQAMACGVPVIVNNASSLPEVVGSAGRLVRAEDCSEVTAALRDIAVSSDLRADMRQRGLMRASEFSWQRTAKQTLSVYNAAHNASHPLLLRNEYQ